MKVDARGFACPMPLIMVEKALQECDAAELEVLVDYECAVENVTRFAEGKGYTVTCSEDDGEYTLSLKK